jgi:uncharacterized Zn finger protein (UPF0148 family)
VEKGERMPECRKCGAKVKEDMSFCPNCGAPLKAEAAPAQPAQQPQAPTHYRSEKTEKHEKQEKREKHEKGEYGWIGPLIGGTILIIIGLVSYLKVAMPTVFTLETQQIVWAFFIIIVGLLLIFAAIYAMSTVRRRHPPTA